MLDALTRQSYRVARTDDADWWGVNFPPSQDFTWAASIECHYRSIMADDVSKMMRKRYAEKKHQEVLEWVRDCLENSQIVWDQFLEPFPSIRKHFNRLTIYFGNDSEAAAFKIMWQ